MLKRISNLLGFVSKQEKRGIFWFLLLCLFSPAVDLFNVSMSIPVLHQAFSQPSSPELLEKILFLGSILLLVGGFELLKSHFASALKADISRSWSVRIYELCCNEELEKHNEKTPVQAINAARSDVAVCADMIIITIELALDILTLAAYFFIITYVAGHIGLVSCIFTAVLMFFLYWRNRMSMTQFGEKKRLLELRVGALISTAYGSYKELRIDVRRNNLLGRYEQASRECARVQKKYAFMAGLQGIVLQNVTQAMLFFTLAAIIASGIDVTGVLSEAVVYVALLMRMIPGARRIVTALTGLQHGTRYYEAFLDEMEQYAQLKEKEKKRAGMREKKITFHKGICVRDLSYCYPNGKQIFEHASIDIPAGQSVALIGDSGAGKTTFLDLLLGLLHPQAGHIWYDDYDIVKECDGEGPCRADIGTIISYIPQIVYLNNETVRNNVTFMTKEQETNEARTIECLKCAQIWEDVSQMPDGLDTLIGPNGTTISGGQRQRIALARALYKDFELLIMDEATAALDMGTEKAVIDSIRQIRRNKTILMVTHHLSLASECEHIYQIEGHRIIKVR
ncbi:MAG: ABC transporter ATP-binding protein [Lachnospiraceae bacterium]|jgi:ABC-type bacteriocin/lantibiotic exporter with double-glycine peptidase domain|nr:ABC transporter ATP-binding protein [Lachnospiraceae bacterium]